MRRNNSGKSQEEVEAKAKEIWEKMNDSERHGVRFGLFPAGIMEAAEAEGFDSMAVPLMELSQRHGGLKS